MASFQSKIGWKRPRKRENKNYNFEIGRASCRERVLVAV